MFGELVTSTCVRNPGGHVESSPRPSSEGVAFHQVLRPLDICMRAQLKRSFITAVDSLSRDL